METGTKDSIRGLGIGIVLLLGAAVGACGGPSAEQGAAEGAGKAAAGEIATAVERGEYLVTILACNDCHTPLQMGPEGPAPDMTRMLSGHPEEMVLPPPPAAQGPWLAFFAATNTAYAGPWGISYAANLTPDENTGMGIWTEEMFVGAMRTGRHMGVSRPILPPMPWPWYGKMTDEDLKAVYAYLRTIPPIHNRVPEPAPPAD